MEVRTNVTSLLDVRDAREFSRRAAAMTDDELADALAADERILACLLPYMDPAVRPRVCRIVCWTLRTASRRAFEVMGVKREDMR
jgi:hypothetical protein